MVKIAFNSEILDLRGTSVSTMDYATYNKTLLGNESIIVVPKSESHRNDELAVENFKKHFQVFLYEDLEDMDRILEEEGCDIIYFIKYGTNNGAISKKIKNVIHCVFSMAEPHGEVYAGVSQHIAEKFGKTLYVPHIVRNPPLATDTMRAQLNIPQDAKVFGYHGGKETFNINFAKDIVRRIVRDYPIYFIFVNIYRFDDHPNTIFLDKIVDLDEKHKFIRSCDAFIDAQSLGNSFGESIAEFSVNNKPIITYAFPSWNKCHLELLGDKAIIYNDADELYKIFETFNPNDYKDKDMNCYRDYTPEKVMPIFKKVFIDEE